MAIAWKPNFTRYSRFGANLGRVTVFDAQHVEDLSGTDELTLLCEEELQKGERIVWRDRQGIWHEHIVDEPERVRDADGNLATNAVCINSIAELWGDYIEDKRPSGDAHDVLAVILSGTRWSAGVGDLVQSQSHIYYHVSVREAIAMICNTYGGEVETTITCNGKTVTGRTVTIKAKRGDQNSKKRFTYTKDLLGISRKTGSRNPVTRVYGYGKGEETDSGGYGRRIDFSAINGGKPYVENTAATSIWGHYDANGNVVPECGTYINEECEDPAQLLAETREYLAESIEPDVTYTADVIDLAAYGRSWEEVALGDLVTVIDKGFTDDGLRIHARITRLERDLLNNDTNVTFGNFTDVLTNSFVAVQQSVNSLNERAASWNGAAEANTAWLDNMMSSLNAAYDSAGTYQYSSFENGLIFSSVPLDENGNPTIAGGNALQIKGGAFRLASETNADGTWKWRSFGTGSGFTADEINAGQLNANLLRVGTISDRYGYNSWNLNTGDLTMSSGYFIDGQGEQVSIDELIDAAQTAGDIMPGGTNLLNGTNELSVLGNPEWSVGGWAGEGDSTKGARKVVTVDCPNNNVTRGFQLYSLDPTDGQLVYQTHVPITRGEKYVLSAYCKGTGKLRVGIGATSYEVVPDESAYNRYYIKFTADATNTLSATQTQISFAQAARGTLNVCGMKLERGNVASDWSASPIDQQRHANKAANSALAQADAHAVELADDAVAYAKAETTKQVTEGINLAKEYTNDISELDRAYTAEQSQAVKDYFTQAEIFNRLTKNGAKKGIYLSNGELYINGTYIKSGVIDANLIKAGIIADNLATPKNIWNLATGYFETKNAVMKNANVTGQFSCGSGNVMELKNGTLTGYFNGSNVGQINYMKSYRDVKSGQSFKGLYLASSGGIGVFTPRFATGTSTSSNATGTYGKTGTYTIKNVAHDLKSKKDGLSWKYGTLKIKVINGLITSISGLDGEWS